MILTKYVACLLVATTGILAACSPRPAGICTMIVGGKEYTGLMVISGAMTVETSDTIPGTDGVHHYTTGSMSGGQVIVLEDAKCVRGDTLVDPASGDTLLIEEAHYQSLLVRRPDNVQGLSIEELKAVTKSYPVFILTGQCRLQTQQL